MILSCSQIHYNHMVTKNQERVLGGLVCEKKPKDLSTSEREKRKYGKGVGVYATLKKSDTVNPYGLAKTCTRTVGVDLLETWQN